MAPSGIEPATFRFVAQRLSHCATAVPPEVLKVLQDFGRIQEIVVETYAEGGMTDCDVLLTVHLSIILAIDQLNVQILVL